MQRRACRFWPLALAASALPAHAQLLPVPVTPPVAPAASPSPTPAPTPEARLTLPKGTTVLFTTLDRLNSKKQAKGDPVRLAIKSDVTIEGRVLIPAGAPVQGIIANSSSTGAFGTTGKLAVAPSWMAYAGRTVRFIGLSEAKRKSGVDTVLGVGFVSGLISGHSREFPAGTVIAGEVLRDVDLPAISKP